MYTEIENRLNLNHPVYPPYNFYSIDNSYAEGLYSAALCKLEINLRDHLQSD